MKLRGHEENYFNDTVKAGNYHNDTKAVKLLIKNSIENINTLIKLGVPFDKTKEKLNYTREGGHSEFRIVHVKDETGKSVTETLLNIVSKKRNITMPNDYIEKINSMSFEEVAKYTIERFNLNESVDSLIKEWNDMAIYEYSNNIKLKPNVKEYLVKLKKHDIKIGLATSSPKELYEPVLKNNKVYDYFDTFTSVDDVKRDKNYPDIYLYTAKKLGLYPNECIIFEDILIAINTAKESNFKAIGVYDKSSYNDLDKIKAYSAASDNIGNFCAQNIFMGNAGILLIASTLEGLGMNVDTLELAKVAIPVALIALVIWVVQCLLLDKKLTKKYSERKNNVGGIA